MAALAASALSASLILLNAPLAAAEAPPWTWDPAGARTLICDGQNVTAYWTPGGVMTAFMVVGSTDVILPKLVEVTFAPGEDPVLTKAVRGFKKNNADSVHCSYTDPQGYLINFWGIRT